MRPFRVVLVNQCENNWGYGPGSSEYLRAQLLAAPDLVGRVEVTLLFLIGLSPLEAAEKILAAEPDLAGFSCYSWNIHESGATCRELRRRGVAFPIVWGGCSFSLFYERSDWFSWWDCVDAVAVGSGEITIVDLARYLLERPPGAGIEHALPGLVVNRDGRRETGPPAKTPVNLDELASPYLNGVQYEVRNPFVEMARGCRFQCTFCSDARASREGQWRVYSKERIAAEVAVVAAWPDIEVIEAGSSTANISDSHFADVCESLRRGDPGMRAAYAFQMYPSISRPSQRQALEGVRIHKLHFGAQSTTPETWGPIKRKTSMDHMARAMAVFGGVGLMQASMLLGIPGETFESFKRTITDLRAMGWSVVVNRLLVLPGTQLHRDHEQFGMRFDEANFRVRATNTMSEADMTRCQDFVREAIFALSDDEKTSESPPIMYSNFDHQPTMFSPMELFRPGEAPPRRANQDGRQGKQEQGRLLPQRR